MPEFDLARLAADVADMRAGHGPRRIELRRRLAEVDPALRHTRNVERARLSGLQARLRGLDTRADSAALQVQAADSAQRLEGLERRILEAIAAVGK